MDTIREKREELGMSRNQLAVRAGISASELILIEDGLRKPQPKTVKAIADALGYDYLKLYNIIEGEN